MARLHLRRGASAAFAAAAITVLVLGGCSKDKGSDGAATTTTGAKVTTTTGAGDATATTKAGGTATTAAGATTTASTAPPTTASGPASTFSGTVPGASDGANVSFERSGSALRSFAVKDLEVTCNPKTGSAGPTTRTIDVTVDSMPVAADGTVDYVGGAPYHPELQGNFTDDGRFSGGLYLSYEADGKVCGGEFSFVLG